MLSKNVDLHMLAPIIALATSRETYDATFGPGGFTAEPLYKLGVDRDRVPASLIEELGSEDLKKQFEAMHAAWESFSGYEDPPCPDDLRLSRLLTFTRELGPLA